VVTAGDYERCVFRGLTRYHHILDPRTGYPARSGLIAATVLASESLAADILSTALLVLGLEAGIALLGAAAPVRAVLVTSDLRVHLSRDLRDRYRRAPGLPRERYF